LIGILGQTASGKTALAVELAQHYRTEIISCDSRQFFKEISIGTAKPTAKEMAGITHHFVDHISINERYTAGKFEEDALIKLNQIFETNPVVIMVGGSGMYAQAIINGIDNIPADQTIREQLTQRLQNESIETLQQELKVLDPVFFETFDKDNPQRLIRALEVCLVTGEPYSNLRLGQKKTRPFQSINFAINWEREALYDRINRRVDMMMENGLLEEAKVLFPKRELNALQTVGYKELFGHFNGEYTLDEAVELIKRNTRRFAKRQMTWFKKMEEVHWIEPDTLLDQIIDTINRAKK
jgi:tRNA dimethylallyltransferase